MTSESPRNSKKPGRIVSLPVIVLAVLATLALGARPGLASLGGARPAGATATPTRTPRPSTPAARVSLADPKIVAPGATSTPTATPAPAPAAEANSTALSPFLQAVVARYQMDAARRFIVVDTDRQRMLIWDPGRPIRDIPVSTGDEARGFRTPAWYGLIGKYWGTFQAFGTSADEGWYLFDAMGGSILIHSAPYLLVEGAKVYENLDALGNYPASRGCIRLRPEDARWLTEWQPQGTPIVILPPAAFGH
jgi:hypothetical protein